MWKYNSSDRKGGPGVKYVSVGVREDFGSKLASIFSIDLNCEKSSTFWDFISAIETHTVSALRQWWINYRYALVY